jgi:hypothetical protein
MKFGILQQPIGTLQIPSRDSLRVFKFAKLITVRKIQNELRSQKRNASRSLPVMLWRKLFQLIIPVFRLRNSAETGTEKVYY